MAEDQQEPQREVVDLRNERGESRQYETVASRLARFRNIEKYQDFALLTEVIKDDGDSIAVKATIGFYTTAGTLCALAVGHAQEWHDSSEINRTACMENAETSAWGRALAAFGFASPLGIASDDEVKKAQARGAALKQQDTREPGNLVLLQNAAKHGTAALQDVWNNQLTKEDRKACSKYMAKLKTEAEKNDGQAKGKGRRANAPRDGGDGAERDSVD